MKNNVLDRLFPCGLSVTVQSLVLKFTCECELGDEAAASALRDGIGRGLKRLHACADPSSCRCACCSIFKPLNPPGFAGGLGPGFVLETPGLSGSIDSGRISRVRLLLLGTAGSALPWFLCALLHCGQVGIGDPRAKFTVDTTGAPRIITSSDILAKASSLAGTRECKIVFDAPFALTVNGTVSEELSFSRLVKAICERLQPNVGYWCGEWMRNSHRDGIVEPLLRESEDADWEFRRGGIVREYARKYDGRFASLLGFKGELRVRGNLDRFWPLLLAGSLVHIGKYPHLDRGRFFVEANGKRIDWD